MMTYNQVQIFCVNYNTSQFLHKSKSYKQGIETSSSDQLLCNLLGPPKPPLTLSGSRMGKEDERPLLKLHECMI